MRTIAQHFDRAAPRYDQSASLQEHVAQRLVDDAASAFSDPQTILDLGCGTGFVTQAAHRRWPPAQITALDKSPAMLVETRRKVSGAKIIAGDAADAVFDPKFDLILSSMMVQWLPDPRAALMRWRGWLKPQGCLYVAVPVQGSFQEWISLCEAHDVANGLWPLPLGDFAAGLAAGTDLQNITRTYPMALDFLRQVKAIGAATPRPGHKPVKIEVFRRLLTMAPRPFPVTYRMLFVKVLAQDSRQKC